MKNGEQPTFPIVNSEGFPSRIDSITETCKTAIGITKREYIIVMAMQAGIYKYGFPPMYEDKVNEDALNSLIMQSTYVADELLKQLES